MSDVMRFPYITPNLLPPIITLSLRSPIERVPACLFSSSWQFSASFLLAASTALPEISPPASSLTASSLPPADNSDKPLSLTPSPWVGHTSPAGRWRTWGRCTGSAPRSRRRRPRRSSSASWRERSASSPTGCLAARSSCPAAQPAVVSSRGKGFNVFRT